MPFKPKLREQIPGWILDLEEDDSDLSDVLVEAAIARVKASRAIRERGNHAPRLCVREFQIAEQILESIRMGVVVGRRKRLHKAADALRKFTVARQCARFLESDLSPRYAKDPGRHPTTKAKGKRLRR